MNKSGFERASERNRKSEENAKRIKAFRAEIYQHLENNSGKAKAFTVAEKDASGERGIVKRDPKIEIPKGQTR